jgi:hypothetical protein
VKSTALRVRHHYHLRRGNFDQAQYWQHEVELDKLTDRSAAFNPSGITQMRDYSAESEGLQVWKLYMAAEYDRLRGALAQALPQHLEILERAAGRHVAWAYAAYGALLCLEGLDRLEEGRALGELLLARAAAAGMTAVRGLILRPLALIEARLGNVVRAAALVEENIARCRELGMGGINGCAA